MSSEEISAFTIVDGVNVARWAVRNSRNRRRKDERKRRADELITQMMTC